jgi:oligopeptide/dipeptide ABC transporter ATP-binding protein
MPPILEVQDLRVQFALPDGAVNALNGVSFNLNEGETLGVLGESGAGKSVTALAIMGLLPYPGKVLSGEVLFRGRDLLKMSESELRKIRAREIAIAFQDPVSSLNPRLTIGQQLEELFRTHRHVDRRQARSASVELLRNVGLPDAERLVGNYIFQVSGGMAQRVMLAIAIALKPPVVLADELTSNLDVTLQAEMLDRLRVLQQEAGTAILLITHDLGVLARFSHRIAVMYAGRVVEEGRTRAFFRHPAHPYSWAMMRALPRVDRTERLMPIPGSPPDMKAAQGQCPFLPRCFKATVTCRTEAMPFMRELEEEHAAACYNPVEASGVD